MSTLRLHGHPISANTRRCRLTLEHLGLPYELAVVDLMGDRAALRALNPNLKIPVLEHGDFVLWESHAIMQYVAELTAGQQLYPAEPRRRADVNRWLFWHNAHLVPPLTILDFERRWKRFLGLGDADPAAVARADQEFEVQLQILDAHLSTRTYFAVDALSLADLSIAATLAIAPLDGVDLAPYVNLRSHLARIAQLPAWATTEPPPMGQAMKP